MVDGLPRREVMGQEAPGATTTEDVEDGIENLAQGMDSRTSDSFRGWQVGLDARPFGIG
jgi:hypothetical protein